MPIGDLKPNVHPCVYNPVFVHYDAPMDSDLTGNDLMVPTKLFKNGNSQAVRIPSELAYGNWDIELTIERHGDELIIRPAQRRLVDVLSKFASFPSNFMAEGRGLDQEEEREAL